MAVQQEDSGTRATVPHPQNSLADIDPLELETVEHARCLSARRSPETSG